MESETDNRIAPDGAIWVCGACGKTSKDRYGDALSDRGWDTSCAMNAVLCKAPQSKDGWERYAAPAPSDGGGR